MTVKSPMASMAFWLLKATLVADPVNVPAVMAPAVWLIDPVLEISDTVWPAAFRAPVRLKP